MRIDFASLAFGFRIKSGGANPNWATSFGQGKEHKINNDPAIDEMLKALIYTSAPLEKISTKSHNKDFDASGNGMVRVNNWQDAYDQIIEYADQILAGKTETAK